MLKKLIAITAFSFSFLLEGFDQKPWNGNWFEFQANTSYTYQNYNRLQSKDGSVKFSANDSFFDLGLSFIPLPELVAAINFEFAKTNEMDFNFDSFSFTGKYIILDDIGGDDIALACGAIVSFPVKKAIHDYSQFYHGLVNFEPYLSLGKEFSKGPYWTYRTWGLVGFGIATRSNPWFDFKAIVEKNWTDIHQLSLIGDFKIGLGTRDLVKEKSFVGYGRINHQSLDIGLKYAYLMGIYGRINLGYVHRVYAKNAPENANLITIAYLIPFSIF